MGTAEEKRKIRERMRARRRGVSAAWAAARSAAVCRKVTGLPEFAEARSVGCYLAMRGEVVLDGVLAACRRAGKRVCVPAWRRRAGRYEFVWLGPRAKIREGRWGVPEPVRGRPARRGELDLAVVPGVAFDRQGNRLGHGGGYYDDLLTRYGGPRPDGRRMRRMGVGFDFQIVDALPVTRRDVRMDAVISERRIIRGQRIAGRGRRSRG